jgi:DNA adenine methylase
MIKANISPAPFLKWVGGKRQLLSQYQQFFPKKYNTYHEPFLGGGAVFFHLQPKNAVLSDINLELIATYEAVRDRAEKLLTLLEQHQANHSPDYYYKVRASFIPTDFVECAARFIYLNKTCFNGLYRVNKEGEFNVPVGSYKNPQICDRAAILAASEALQGKTITRADFDISLIYPEPGDFVFADPPYHPINKTSSFDDYTAGGFGKVNQEKLRDRAIELVKRDVQIMIANSDCEFIRELYCDRAYFQIHEVSANRAVNSKASGRGKVSELVILGAKQ